MTDDEVMQDKLRAFTRRVASTLSYEECQRLLAERRGSMVEYEPPDAKWPSLTYLWEVLALEEVAAGRCARILTHVCDDRRWGLGSAYTPLCSGAWVFEDGRVEVFPIGNAAARMPPWYLVVGLLFIGLELWRLTVPKPHSAVLPLWAGLLIPALIGIAALRRTGRDRLAVLAMAALTLFAFNRISLGDPPCVSVVVLGCAAFVACVGYSTVPADRRRGLRPVLWSAAAVLLAFSLFYVLMLL